MIVETECFLYDKHLSELGVDTEDIIAKTAFDTDNIESFRERGCDETGEICKKTCMVYFKSGESIQINMPYLKMKQLYLNKK